MNSISQNGHGDAQVLTREPEPTTPVTSRARVDADPTFRAEEQETRDKSEGKADLVANRSHSRHSYAPVRL